MVMVFCRGGGLDGGGGRIWLLMAVVFIAECDSDYGGSGTIYITNGEFDGGCIAMVSLMMV